MSTITDLAVQVREKAGEYPQGFREENPQFSASIETAQGTTMRVRCPGDQDSILALARRLEKGENRRKKELRHPLPLPSRVNLGAGAFSETTFRELTREDPAGAVQYAGNMDRSIAFDAQGEPLLVLKRPQCLAPFPDLVLVMDGRGAGGGNRYGVIHLRSGLWVGAPNTSTTKAAAIAAMEHRREQLGDQKIHAVMRQHYNPAFQGNHWKLHQGLPDGYRILMNDGIGGRHTLIRDNELGEIVGRSESYDECILQAWANLEDWQRRHGEQ